MNFKKHILILSTLVILLSPISASAFTIFGWSFSDLFGSSLNRGLVGHWTFDGKHMISNVADASGKGNHGRLILGATGNTATTTGMGVLGQAIVLDGLSDHVDSGNASNLQISNGTVSAWVTTSNPGSGYRAIAAKQSAYGMFLFNNDLGIYDWGSNQWRSSGVNLNDGIWHHVLLSFQSGVTNGTFLYLDGVLVLTTTMTVGNQGAPFLIGHGNSSTQQINALIDDVRVYDRVLSEEEIGRLYTMGAGGAKTGVAPSNDTLSATGALVGHWTFDGKNMISNVADSSGEGNHGMLVGQMATTTAPGRIGQALVFDGVNDFVELGQVLLDITIPVTISLWVKPNTIVGVKVLFHSNTPNTNCCNYRGVWLTMNANNTIAVNYGSGTGAASSGRRSKSSTAAIIDGEWTHVVAVVRGATDMTIYFNNVDAGGSYSGTGGALQIADDPAWTARIGRAEQGSVAYYSGLMDDVRFYDRALSAEEVARLYVAGR